MMEARKGTATSTENDSVVNSIHMRLPIQIDLVNIGKARQDGVEFINCRVEIIDSEIGMLYAVYADFL